MSLPKNSCAGKYSIKEVKMKRAKRFLVFCLSCALALSTATLTPITVRAEGTLPDVDASGVILAL